MRQLLKLTLAATLALSATAAYAEEVLDQSLPLEADDGISAFDRSPGRPGHGWPGGPRPGWPGGGHGPGYPPAPPAPPAPSYDRVGDCIIERDGGYSSRYVIYDEWHYRIADAWSYGEAYDIARRANYDGRCSRGGGGGGGYPGYGRRAECRINVYSNVFVGYGSSEWEATSDARSQCLRVYNNSYTCNDPAAVCRFY